MLKKILLGNLYNKCKDGFVDKQELTNRLIEMKKEGIISTSFTIDNLVNVCGLKTENSELNERLNLFLDKYYNMLLSNKNIKVLSSGGNGKIVSINDENVVFKLIYNKCKDASKEFIIQLSIYNSIDKGGILKVPQPYKFYSYPFEDYSCYFAMEKIEGFPTSLLTSNKECLSLFKEVQVMLVFNNRYNRILHLKDINEECSIKNPPRYITMYVEEFKIDIKKICFELGIFFGMASFYNKISLDDVEVIINKNFEVYIVDFGLCRDVSLLVDSYLKDENNLDELLDDGIAYFTTPFLTKECFPTPKNTEYWPSFVEGLIISIKRYTSLSKEQIDNFITKLEEYIV